MRGLSKRKLAVVGAVSSIATGIAILGSSSAVQAAENGAQTRPSGNDVKNADDGRIELHADTIRLQFDGKPGDAAKVITAEGANGQPVIIRIVADEAPAAGKDGQDDSDIVRRLRERRARELAEAPKGPADADRERRADVLRARLRAEEAAKSDRQGAVAGLQIQSDPETPAPGRIRGLVGELATRAASIVAPGKKEKTTFLGVGASPAPPVLTHQLHLPADFGLVIDEVAPESPADKAGLKQFDLLQKLDDQFLVDDRQLTALIHSHKPGETVTLTVVREGKPLTLKAKLGEHEETAEGEGRFMLQFGGLPPEAEGAGPENIGTFRLPPGLPGANGLNVARRPGEPLPPPAAIWASPLPGQPPVPPVPGGGVVLPPREGRRPEDPRTNSVRSLPATRPVSPAEPRNADADADEARRLEEELRTLRNTADELRAQLEKQKKQEAEEQKGNAPIDKDQKDGEKP